MPKVQERPQPIHGGVPISVFQFVSDLVEARDEVETWKEIESEEVLVSTNVNRQDALAAKFEELQKWKDHRVYDEVENEGQKTISTRWICSVKEDRTKARLVARGFEDTDCTERTDSPTCTKSNLRLIIAISAAHKWRINSLDVQSAFLQGEELTRSIYLEPPVEANTDKLWKLNRCVYGLKQASRMWYLRVTKELALLQVSKSKYDEAIFYWMWKGKLQGVLAAHVDDFFWAGTDLFKEKIIDNLITKFKISSDLHDSFKFLGLQVHQEESGITVRQNSYAEQVQSINISEDKDKRRPLEDEERAMYRKTIGQIGWVANQTRPDLAYDACQLSVAYKNATVEDAPLQNRA